MTDGIPGIMPQHTGPGITHDPTHPFPHFRLVAMYFTVAAGRFSFTEPATVQPGKSVLLQLTAAITHSPVTLFAAAIQADHLCDHLLFVCDPVSGHVELIVPVAKISINFVALQPN